MIDPYETLGVSRDANTEEIRKAYRRASKEAHPDREGGDHDRQAHLNMAYRLLTDESSRKRYDSGERFDQPVDNRSSNAIELLITVFDSVIDGMVSASLGSTPFTRVRASLVQYVTQGYDQIRKLDSNRQRILQNLAKIRAKGREANIFDDRLKARVEEINNAQAQMESQIETVQLAMKILDEYEDGMPQEPTFSAGGRPTLLGSSSYHVFTGEGGGPYGGGW